MVTPAFVVMATNKTVLSRINIPYRRVSGLAGWWQPLILGYREAFSMRFFVVCLSSILMLTLSGCAYFSSHEDADTYAEYGDGSSDGVLSAATARQGQTQSAGFRLVDPSELETVDVLRTGRYQLVTTQAPTRQRQLLEQPVHLQVSPLDGLTVGDGVRRLLINTGFELCPVSDQGLRQLFSLALPHQHFEIGPMSLRQALTVIVSEGWALEADLQRRVVCFSPRNLIRDVVQAGMSERRE